MCNAGSAVVMAVEFIIVLKRKKPSTVIEYEPRTTMTTPLLDLEGTWEEIVAQIPNFSGQKLRVLVYPATEIAQKGTIPVLLPRYWPRLPRPSLPESLPSYRQTLLTNSTTISTAPLSDEAGFCRYAILGGQHHAG